MDLSNYQSFLDSLLVILVLYESDLETSESFQSVETCLESTNSTVDIFIYDNSRQKTNSLLNIYNSKIYYVWDSSNPGVSKAYNEASSVAKQLNKKWLLLLDQDTDFPTDILMKYYLATIEQSSIYLFAPILKSRSGKIYSPCKYIFSRGFSPKTFSGGAKSCRGLSLLNSGMLITLDTFVNTGKYDENLKLDFTDAEFIERYKKIYDFFFIIDVEAIHDFSDFTDELSNSLSRYTRYCDSVSYMKSISSSFFDRITLLIFSCTRALKLSIKFKSLDFFIPLFKLLIS